MYSPEDADTDFSPLTVEKNFLRLRLRETFRNSQLESNLHRRHGP